MTNPYYALTAKQATAKMIELGDAGLTLTQMVEKYGMVGPIFSPSEDKDMVDVTTIKRPGDRRCICTMAATSDDFTCAICGDTGIEPITEGAIKMTTEEMRDIYNEFCLDVSGHAAKIAPADFPDIYHQFHVPEESIKHALVRAVERERERCLSEVNRICDLNDDDNCWWFRMQITEAIEGDEI